MFSCDAPLSGKAIALTSPLSPTRGDTSWCFTGEVAESWLSTFPNIASILDGIRAVRAVVDIWGRAYYSLPSFQLSRIPAVRHAGVFAASLTRPRHEVALKTQTWVLSLLINSRHWLLINHRENIQTTENMLTIDSGLKKMHSKDIKFKFMKIAGSILKIYTKTCY